MQNMEQQKNSDNRVLADAELDAISGGNWLGDIGRWIVRRFQGPGDLRPATRRPD
jgi:hypothetical protein